MTQTERVRIGVVGLGKMGLSHFALVNAHPLADTVACEATGFLADMLGRNISAPIHRDYDKMLNEVPLDAVLIATPSSTHATMVRKALDRGLHVFCEKPFCLDCTESEALADLAEDKGLVAQVGYHNRHIGAFQEARRIVASGALGRITQVLAEAYGPVVLKPKRATWRNKSTEGGGCLYDYAAHPLNLLNWMFGVPDAAMGTVLTKVFSADTDDAVSATLRFPDGPIAQLSVNWSDESHRKMTTRLTMIGEQGRLFVDRQECQLYLRTETDALPGYEAGWNVRYTTDLTQEPWFYLRGEEYSHQIDRFLRAIQSGASHAEENDFRSAAATDRTIAMMLADAAGQGTAMPASAAAPERTRRWFGRR